MSALAKLKVIATDRVEFLEAMGIPPAPAHMVNTPTTADLLDQLLTYGNAEARVFTFPWLTRRECEELIELGDRIGYQVNEEEDGPYQIPEVVFANECPEAYYQWKHRLEEEVLDVAQFLTGITVSTLDSVQLARYTPQTVPRGNFHLDQDSDLTVTVALNDGYEPGGFQIATGGVLGELVELPRATIGTATVFLGRSHLHQGLPVQSGQRDLLVFWSKM